MLTMIFFYPKERRMPELHNMFAFTKHACFTIRDDKKCNYGDYRAIFFVTLSLLFVFMCIFATILE